MTGKKLDLDLTEQIAVVSASNGSHIGWRLTVLWALKAILQGWR